MVGAGTGIAPFRSFWQERKIDMEMMQIPSGINGIGWGKMYLYFGCRQSKLDDLYSNELDQLVKEKVIATMYLAFSREQNKKKACLKI
jgi:sulfite reductase alpha subunit-like flavoprotein